MACQLCSASPCERLKGPSLAQGAGSEGGRGQTPFFEIKLLFVLTTVSLFLRVPEVSTIVFINSHFHLFTTELMPGL